MKGFFLVLEGPDFSGKSTQAARLVQALGAGREIVHTREPGGTFLSEALRKVVLDPNHQVTPLAELLLYEAARAQHVQERLRPALKRGALVLCERYTMATLAYQAYGRRLPLALVKQLNRIATGGLEPDLTVVVTIPERALRGRRRSERDRLESAPDAFRRRVARAYRRLAKGPRIVHVDGGRTPEAVGADIEAAVRRALAKRGLS